MSAVSRLLIAEGENLVTVPEHVLKDVQEVFPESDTLTWVTPSYVRDVLHRSEAENLSKDDKYSLLEFALSDEKYTELQGLKLLPLSDGTFTSFGNGVQNTVLIDNEKFPRTLLPFCKEWFLPNALSHFCTMQLRKLATRSIYNIISLDAQHVVTLMKKHLPMDWKVTQGHVCNHLGLYDPPPAEKVLENLSALRSMVNPNSDFQFKIELHSIYKFMQDNMTSFRDLMDTKCFPWIWNKREFVCPGDIVLIYPPELDLSSYIKKVPEEFLQYEYLLTQFGVKKTLSDEEIEDILHGIKHRIDRRCPPHGDSTELKVTIAILDWMRKNEKHLKDSTPVPVMAQNQNFTLQSLSKTVFCDISAEGLEDLKQDNEEFYVIHEEVLPPHVQDGNKSILSTRILKPQFIQAEQEFFGIEQCGQSEPITQRIKNILKEYDEESDIFKELLQNAEDAGATTCKFLLDFRKHRDPPETLFDDGMALCSGPCLWIFNNELFSQEDWKNIVKVGSASKENKVEMIGKFGLGFNSVYHPKTARNLIMAP
ncbi:hypothetical protein cypCar_00027428 [Cyprinus carpio]|nr:hypothetical protein cypCar_00027428 [Cyprinus carpio]